MPPVKPEAVPGSPLDIPYLLRRYARLLWRWKWFVAGAAPVVALVTFLYLHHSMSEGPELTATVLIGVENVSEFTAVQDVGGTAESRTAIMHSHTFLREIVESLSLRVVIPDHARAEIFSSVDVDSSAPPGEYVFDFDDEGQASFTLYYTNRSLGRKDHPITTKPLDSLSTLSLRSISLRFSEQFLADPFDFTFYVRDPRRAVESLNKELVVETPDPRRERYNISVSMAGRDYQLIADIVNLVADRFVERNLSLRRQRGANALEVLEKQYVSAKEELSSADGRLRYFRSKYPTVGLSQSAQRTLDNLVESESTAHDADITLSEARNIGTRLANASDDSKELVVAEALAFLSDHGQRTAQILEAELTELMAERRSLEGNYASSHPMVTKNRAATRTLYARATTALDDFTSELSAKVGRGRTTAESLTDKLRSLPSRELQLAKLQRQQQVASDVYSMVLRRYNQAKVADAVTVGDVYVLDYAMPPLPPPLDAVRLLLIALAVGLGVTLVPPFVYDFFDRTAHTTEDLERLTSAPVIQTLPKLRSAALEPVPNEVTDTSMLIGLKGQKAEYASELFRHLRAKVRIALDAAGDNSLIVAGYDTEVGKSTISANLAAGFARRGMKTVLIDGDLRRPTQGTLFRLSKHGLFDFLRTNKAPLTSIQQIEPLLQDSHFPNLQVIAAGTMVDPGDPELLSGQTFAQLKQLLSAHFDMVILDSPPLGLFADAVNLHELFGGYLVVVKAGASHIDAMNKGLEEYPVLQKKLLGLVLNQTPMSGDIQYYHSKYRKYNPSARKKAVD